MVAVDAPPAPSRRRTVPRSLAALLVVVCSLCMVWRTQPPAQAWVPPVPIAIAGGALSASPMTGGVVGGLCATGVGCLALGAVGLGLTLWATQDTWMPWVDSFFNEPETLLPNGGLAAGGCSSVSLTNVLVSATNIAAHGHMPFATCNSTTQLGMGAQMHVQDLKCDNGVGGPTMGTGGSTIGPVVWTGQNVDFNYDFNYNVVDLGLCPPGYTITQVTVYLKSFEANKRAESPRTTYLGPLPPNQIQIITDVTCKRPDGSTFTIQAAETMHPERLVVPSCRSVDPSSRPDSMTASSTTDSTPIITWSAPDWMGEYPDCFGPSGLLCDIRVYTHGNPCEVGMESCERWWDHRGDPSWDLDCKFGNYVVPFSHCEPLKRAYRTGTGTETITDPEPAWPNSDPEPEITDPNPNPPTTGPNPNAPTIPDVGTVDPDTTSCMGGAWSWNPVDWVYVPTKCALIWAFVPKTSLSVRLGRIRDVASVKAPFTWLSGLGSIPTATGNSCPDWRIKIPGQLDKNVVCDSSFTSAIRGARPVLLVFMGSLALWPLVRSVMYGTIPIIRATPGKL